MGIAAFVLGIVGVAVTLIFDAGFLIGAPIAMVALALGWLGRRPKPISADDFKTGSTWSAKAGLLLGAGGLLVSLYWWVPFIGAEVTIYRLSRPTARLDVNALVKKVGAGDQKGRFVEVGGVVVNTKHMPYHETVALRAADSTDNWRVVCAPLGGALPDPEPVAGEPLAVRGRIRRVDSDLAVLFGRRVVLDPCVIIGSEK